MIRSEANAGWRIQEFQFDKDLDPWSLRALRTQHRIGGRAAREIRDLWQDAVLTRIKLVDQNGQVAAPSLGPRFAGPPPRRLTLTIARRSCLVEIHVKVWIWNWETALIGCLSYEQLAPFLRGGKLRPRNYGNVLPLVVRHRVYVDADMMEMPELRCLLAGKLPELSLA